ncbi:MBL fold metallo-hydrolase RNA specificity domain-containing protein [Kordiimonas sp.]|uniref:MBL fold metallo-hydrolase RNA specificity domain-containing protein n=1 Tax=Kordiimonas sp. TaxID=1970157 RepID=UPI003A92B756
MKLAFMGAAGTVTGSKYLLSGADSKIMVDCGLFQGLKDLRLKNWAPLEVAPSTIDAVLLTHAHLDHSGHLPLLAREGFFGPIYCTGATADLCSILLRDSAYLQEKDAEFANRYGFSKHKPARPLYTSEDAEKVIGLLRSQKFDHPMHVQNGIEATFRIAGHILGASTISLQMEGRTIVFSGDLGRLADPVMLRPAQVESADYLIVESTYGNRKHEDLDVEARLADIISSTAARGGSVIVPAFAVGRTQSLLYYVSRLKKAGRIPDLPVFLDSPMAINASKIYCDNREVHRLSDTECKAACSVAKYTRKVEESKKLTYLAMPSIIISASGMATGGRILHHLKHYVADRQNTILFTGFQAAGTRGRAMVEGARQIKIHGSYIPVNAHVENLDALSAHADCDEILEWLSGLQHSPKTTFVTHGEPEASAALAARIRDELGWHCEIPELGQEVELP